MSSGLQHRVVLVTGAARGIGLAIALRAARDGANIAIAAKTETPHPRLEGTIHTAAEAIVRAGGRALPLAADVREGDVVITIGAGDITKAGPALLALLRRA